MFLDATCGLKCKKGFALLYGILYFGSLAADAGELREFLNAHGLHDLTVCPVCLRCYFEHSEGCEILKLYSAGNLKLMRHFAEQVIGPTIGMSPENEKKVD